MKQNLLKEMETGSKNALLKKRIITHYIYNGSSTITDLAKELDLSVPTTTKFINEMCEDNYINDYGKLETSSGRHPSLYGLNPESGYFIGVDIKKFAINIGLINFKGDMVEIKMNIPYKFENTQEALEELCALIRNFIKGTEINDKKIKKNQWLSIIKKSIKLCNLAQRMFLNGFKLMMKNILLLVKLLDRKPNEVSSPGVPSGRLR